MFGGRSFAAAFTALEKRADGVFLREVADVRGDGDLGWRGRGRSAVGFFGLGGVGAVCVQGNFHTSREFGGEETDRGVIEDRGGWEFDLTGDGEAPDKAKSGERINAERAHGLERIDFLGGGFEDAGQRFL